ncbi:sodium-coupled monocarboxylate transporter 1 [Ixodes scapularis]
MEKLVEYAVFAVLMVANFGLGLYFSFYKKAREVTAEEVFLGSNTLKMLPLALSALASIMSSLGIIGVTGHVYAYGLHVYWNHILAPINALIIAYIIIPVIYKLKVTSVFEYLCMRYGNTVGLTACVIYFFLSQTLGAVAIFPAAAAVSTIFGISLNWCSLVIGLTGTIYTALASLRGVVWTDCAQAVLVLLAPITIITKVLYDSYYKDVRLRPLSDMNWKAFAFESSFDLTKEENVWACLFGLSTMYVYRGGIDQMIVQRYLAARNLKDAQRTAKVGTLLLFCYYATAACLGLVMVYWFRDCDPLLSGAITSYDQIVPYYVRKYLDEFPCFTGLFLAGVVSAATSTISSLINSQAAVLYVDILSKCFHLKSNEASKVTKLLAFGVGVTMTAYGMAAPYLGSACRIIMVLYNGATGPFVGLFFLAITFPWANGWGAGISTTVFSILQLWQMLGKTFSGYQPPKMAVTIDYCPANSTSQECEQACAPRTAECSYEFKADDVQLAEETPM